VLKEVRCLWWQPLLVHELRLHQLVQPMLQGPLAPWRDRLEEGIGKLMPECRPELRQALHRPQAIQPGHQRVVQRRGNRQRREGPAQLIAMLTFLE